MIDLQKIAELGPDAISQDEGISSSTNNNENKTSDNQTTTSQDEGTNSSKKDISDEKKDDKDNYKQEENNNVEDENEDENITENEDEEENNEEEENINEEEENKNTNKKKNKSKSNIKKVLSERNGLKDKVVELENKLGQIMGDIKKEKIQKEEKIEQTNFLNKYPEAKGRIEEINKIKKNIPDISLEYAYKIIAPEQFVKGNTNPNSFGYTPDNLKEGQDYNKMPLKDLTAELKKTFNDNGFTLFK